MPNEARPEGARTKDARPEDARSEGARPKGASDLEGILHFVPLGARIGTAGQPTAEQLRAIGEAGYEVMVNLAMPGTPTFLEDEASVVAAQGMKYIAQPVVWTAPTLEDVKRFFATMHEHRNEKVFVHCAMNMRVAAFLYLYRVKVQGTPEPEARAAMERIWTPNETWQQLINEVIQDGVVDRSVDGAVKAVE